jgi:doublecortin-like kinase 3
VVVKDEPPPETGRSSKGAKKTEEAERESRMSVKKDEKKEKKSRERKSPVKDNKEVEKEEGKETENTKANKQEENKEAEKVKEKKPKTKAVVKKTKLERQISSLHHVMDKFEVGKKLGDGNFAIVKQCQNKETKKEFAMKVIDKAKLKGKEHMIENEIEIMKKCNQPNIVRLFEEFETKDDIYLIMELVKV